MVSPVAQHFPVQDNMDGIWWSDWDDATITIAISVHLATGFSSSTYPPRKACAASARVLSSWMPAWARNGKQ